MTRVHPLSSHLLPDITSYRQTAGSRVAYLARPASSTEHSLRAIHQHSQHSDITIVSNGDTQSRGKHSPQSVRSYSKYLSKRCPDVYKVDKYYVGRLKELPPPSSVQGKWDEEVRPDLERHLCQATNMLSKSMPDEEVITEPVLCMAGKKCSPTSVPLEPGATCPKDPVALHPTIWIYCGGRKCKKQVSKAVSNLTYLQHFLKRFSMEAPHISLYAPWPAVREHSPVSPHQSLHQIAPIPTNNISFAIQQMFSGQETICGARARFSIGISGGKVERYSTIGGLIVVDNSLFVMTSAHAIVNWLLANSRGIFSDETGSRSDMSTSADSESDTSSDSGSATSIDSTISCSGRVASPGSPLPEARSLDAIEEGIWTDLGLPRIMAYMTHGTINGDYSFPYQAPSTSDFALAEVRTGASLLNEYYDPDDDSMTMITDHMPVQELSSEFVWIVTKCGNTPLKGYLLAGDACVILRGTVMRTKKIQIPVVGGMFILSCIKAVQRLTKIDAHGMSGSWVVRGGTLYGIVYAAYDRSPYLHMLPAENLFRDIAELLQASEVRVAKAQDIHDHQVLLALHTSNIEGIVYST